MGRKKRSHFSVVFVFVREFKWKRVRKRNKEGGRGKKEENVENSGKFLE